ncbi:chemotaxis protein (plasmid) [Methylocystis sp. MJC1]|jgi:methyl-accepting chemotaxis protein|nr:chemotaxis protein [Methylocystis sp. MJC1]
MTRSFSRFESSSLGKTAVIAAASASVFAALSGFSGAYALEHLGAVASAAFGVVSLIALAKNDRAHARVINKIAAVCGEAAKGNFEARITDIQEIGAEADAQHKVNDMIDRSDAFVREATASLAAVCRNIYYRRIFLEGMDGAFRNAADVINDSVKAQSAVEAARAKATAEQTQIVDELGQGLKSLAEGDLTFRLENFPETYSRLEQDFNAAAGQLEGTLTGIIGGANMICSTTREITSAANDLARRTEQAAAGLEETAAAIHEISNTVVKTTEGARQARETVSHAKSEAEKSNEIVRGAIDTMSRIEKSSQDIGQIIGVIDEIAFQTNLLALNAGVEAARAGDAGRGFAVVAAEVRALAQRSAEAAKEIRGLISVSSDDVRVGVERVTQTGKALERIVGEVVRVNQIIAEMASGASEQSAAIQQINIAIGQMDQDTQKNAAMVEETTAATHNLLQETEGLVRSVQDFKVAQDLAGRDSIPSAARKSAPVVALKHVASTDGAAVRKLAANARESGWEEF